MSWKKRQCSGYLLFRQCYWHQKNHGWCPLARFPCSMNIRCPHLRALMPRWLHGKENGNDKIPRSSQQLHQQLWRRSTIWWILTNITECLNIFSSLPVTTCECEKNVSVLRRLKHINKARCHRRNWQALPCRTFITTWTLTFLGSIEGEWNWQIHCVTDSKRQKRTL